MTYSRSGLVIAILAGAATFVLAGREALSAFWGWVLAGFNRRRWTSLAATLQTAGTRILLAVLVLAILAGAAIFLADKGYIAAFFKSEKTDLFSYAQDVYLGPRLAYSVAALTAFDTHPLTGVGLGASGFGIYQNMPDWILAGEPEIARQMSPAANLYPNPKNLYVRLLTETGLLGFILFLAFYLALFADALSLLNTSRMGRWLAAAGIFALTAIVLQGISQDSFAMPEMWINLGILAGAAGAFQAQPQAATGINNTKKQKEVR
jgi:O-antigen ligase